MATLVLAAAGSAVGGALGGAVLGVGSAAIGQGLGALAGGLIDAKLLGRGGDAVTRGRADNLRIQSAAEGAPIPRLWGRMRVAGQVIWATRFKESVSTSGSGGGKGTSSPSTTTREVSYSISFAVALCEGRIDRIGRVWADGAPFDLSSVAWRLHRGGEGQGPDPLIEAVEGEAPAYRGVAYIVFEDMPVGRFGNRVPQISVEVMRSADAPASLGLPETEVPLDEIVRGVAMSPGTGEFSLATEPVTVTGAEGADRLANVNSISGDPDFVVALDQLEDDLPACGAVSLIVSWFGDDLRAGRCALRPGVEFRETQSTPQAWSVNGVGRGGAHLVGRDGNDRPIYGGTPSDASVVQSIREMKARGLRVMFYPFILMDIAPGNGLDDPWGWGAEQPAFPWRGRITTEAAPGQPGSTDQTAAAAAEVASFFGAAEPGDFTVDGEDVGYAGPAEWTKRRFILHYAHLCAAAGGVDSFCIGSEMRSLTQIRSDRTTYPAVAEMRRLAQDVAAILPDAKIGYAADWSEYFGHQPPDGSGDRIFHLDPLWADDAIDFIGIDWYQPLTDWRDGDGHLDAEIARSIYDLDYLTSRFTAGEGWDFYYASQADRDAQVRTPIFDSGYGEHWVFRPKDVRNWWRRRHHDRVGGVRSNTPTGWRPRSKPIWLTEIGCGAVDKGTNQPNIFFDPKSVESGLPHYSSGAQDDLIQRRLIQAAELWLRDGAKNPVSSRYGGRMIARENVFVWTWDARPWPEFPERLEVWSDGGNHRLGHWLTGRVVGTSLAAVVAEICADAGVTAIDVSDLHGVVTGFAEARTQSGRDALQSLMLGYAFDGFESGGTLRFTMRGGPEAAVIEAEDVVAPRAGAPAIELTRAPAWEAPAETRLRYIQADRDYQTGVATARATEPGADGVEGSDLPLVFTRGRAQGVAERWVQEADVARDGARLALPPSMRAVEPGDVLRLPGEGGETWRVDRIVDGLDRRVEATRVDRGLYGVAEAVREVETPRAPAAAVAAPAYRLMDVPWALFGGDETLAFAATWADPWPGSVAVHRSPTDTGFERVGLTSTPSRVGKLLDPLPAAAPWRWQRGEGVRVEMLSGTLAAVSEAELANGANLAALSLADGSWEVIQFRDAVLEAPATWRISRLSRGVFGTEPLIDGAVPPGATLVMLDARLLPLELDDGGYGVERRWRIGPASAALSDPSVAAAVFTHSGAGLRPFAPTGMAVAEDGGDLSLSWIRRSRRELDLMVAPEAPLAEAFERYRVRVYAPDGTTVLRQAEVAAPAFDYPAALQAADGAGAPVVFGVAQISEVFGPGFEARINHG